MKNEKIAPEVTETPAKPAKSKRSFLFTYIFALFTIALVLVLLSYFSQIRAAREEIEDLTEEHSLFTVSALSSIEKLTDQLNTLHADLSAAQDEIDALNLRREELEDELVSLQREQDGLASALAGEQSKNAALSDKYTALEAEKADADFSLFCAMEAEEVLARLGEKEYEIAAAAVLALRERDGEGRLAEFPTLYLNYKNAVTKLTKLGYLD